MANTVEIMTPICEAYWAQIKTPDYKYDSNGVYKIKLAFNKTIKEHKDFLNSLKAHLPTGAQNKPWKVSEDDSNIILVEAKQPAEVSSGGKTYTFKPAVFDASGGKVTDIPLIGNGSTVRCNLEVRSYDARGGGIRLNPKAIQLVNLIEYEAPVDNVFGAVEGGSYVASEQTMAPANEAPANTNKEPEDDDDF